MARAVLDIAEKIKVVVLVEKDPLTDKFVQILFTEKQMQRVMEAIEKEVSHKDGILDLVTGEKEYHIRDIQDHI